MFRRKSKLASPNSKLVPAGRLSLEGDENTRINVQNSKTTSRVATSIPTKPSTNPSSDNTNGERLKTHIEVCARIRPLEISKERVGYFASGNKSMMASPRKRLLGKFSPTKTARGKEFCAWDVSSDNETAAQSERTDIIEGRTNSYTLDKLYGTSSTTQELYEKSIHPLVKSAMEGYHSSVLAYGQTSTGKTYTMSGTKEAPGLIPLCIQDCFRYVRDSQEPREYLIRVSYLEVYKEHIRDLLASTPEPIRLFDGPNGLIIRGLKEEVVSTPAQVFAILKKGESRRQVGATRMNEHSSRSHVLVRLWIESTSTIVKNTRVSSLSLVDLAGSESVKLNGIERREEGHYINKSLMTLGQVVLSLSEGKTGHIPYRDSKLTRILQPSLSGNAQMVLLCCISPQASHIEESHNTFKFAVRAKKIKQKAILNVADEETTLLQNYREEIEDLRKQLTEAKEQQQRFAAAAADNNNSMAMDEELRELVEAIKTMERLILKSRPHTISPIQEPSDLNLLAEDDERQTTIMAAQQGGMILSTPTKEDDEALNMELGRIRGLLGTVLKKKGIDDPTNRALDFGTPTRSPENDAEVEALRHQLEEQEMVTTLRKADSSFLQQQLREKDMLLEEVSNVLEAVEVRQAELDQENAALRAELFALKAKYNHPSCIQYDEKKADLEKYHI